jgi:DNA topoisomerase II
VKKEKYERKTPIEHILLRPGMYVGQISPALLNTWVYNEKSMKMEKSNIYFSPALVKVRSIIFPLSTILG